MKPILPEHNDEITISEIERKILEVIIRYYEANNCEKFASSYVASALGHEDKNTLNLHLRNLVKQGLLRYEGYYEKEQLYALEEKGYMLFD
jgi:hypothetical protein